MKKALQTRAASILFATLAIPSVCAIAQTAAPAPTAAASSAQPAAPGGDRLTPSELEQLLGPIALYPDPLLANVLAASVYPDEVAAAAAFMAGGAKPEQVDTQSWEDPVKAVAKIPDAIKMMGEFKDWTVALGQAYLLQSKDVMDVVQTLRKKAQSTGALQTSPQQKVVVEQETVYIKPADPEVIYVPSYSPSVVYVDDDDGDEWAAGVIGFGVGITTGLILANNIDCDWHGGCVAWGGGYHGGWGGGHNDIDFEGDVNINTGDRNTNVSGNRTGNTNAARGGNTNTAARGGNTTAGNRVGQQGNAWSPNKSKSLATSQSSKLNQYKGGAASANRPNVPGARNQRSGAGAQPAARNMNNAGGGAGRQGDAAAGRTGANANARTGDAAGGRTDAARSPSTPNRAGDASAARSKAGGETRAPTPKPSTPRVPPTPPTQRQPSQGAFSGGNSRETRSDSQRGASSRSSSKSSEARPSRSSSGGSHRSAGGGGGRSGGGRGGGGRR